MSVEEIKLNLPNPDVITYVENLLKCAKEGELQSLAVVYSRGNRITGNGWTGMHLNNLSIIGELEALKTDMLHLLVDLRAKDHNEL